MSNTSALYRNAANSWLGHQVSWGLVAGDLAQAYGSFAGRMHAGLSRANLRARADRHVHPDRPSVRRDAALAAYGASTVLDCLLVRVVRDYGFGTGSHTAPRLPNLPDGGTARVKALLAATPEAAELRANYLQARAEHFCKLSSWRAVGLAGATLTLSTAALAGLLGAVGAGVGAAAGLLNGQVEKGLGRGRPGGASASMAAWATLGAQLGTVTALCIAAWSKWLPLQVLRATFACFDGAIIGAAYVVGAAVGLAHCGAAACIAAAQRQRQPEALPA